MHVFISWSGERAGRVASDLHTFLPDVVPRITAFVSTADIEKGSRWANTIADNLDRADYGIICITKDRLNAPWLLFEAGALSRSILAKPTARVATLLIDLRDTEVPQPLGQFQATSATQKDIFALCESVNAACGKEGTDPAQLRRLFDRAWPELHATLNEQSQNVETARDRPSQSEMLENVLTEQRQMTSYLATLQSVDQLEIAPHIAASTLSEIRAVQEQVVQGLLSMRAELDSKLDSLLGTLKELQRPERLPDPSFQTKESRPVPKAPPSRRRVIETASKKPSAASLPQDRAGLDGDRKIIAPTTGNDRFIVKYWVKRGGVPTAPNSAALTRLSRALADIQRETAGGQNSTLLTIDWMSKDSARVIDAHGFVNDRLRARFRDRFKQDGVALEWPT